MRLDGKVAVVTGGGSGLGRASAVAMAKEGAAILIGDLSADTAAETAAMITKTGGRASAMAVDVTDADDCLQLMEAAVGIHGGLHILHANAGISLPGEDGPTAEMDPAVWDRVIAVNLSGVFYCCHHALPRMAASGGGSIVNTCSSMAHLPLGNMDGYASSKGGVANLTKSMAASAAKLGVRVNGISPGYVETNMTSMIWQIPEAREAFALGHADGLQTAEEIADVVVFLASDESRSLTGAVLTCDRGWTAFKMPDLVRRFS